MVANDGTQTQPHGQRQPHNFTICQRSIGCNVDLALRTVCSMYQASTSLVRVRQLVFAAAAATATQPLNLGDHMCLILMYSRLKLLSSCPVDEA